MTTTEWYKNHNCDHAHCPCECDHPQPYIDDDDNLICGQCSLLDGIPCKMIPCTPQICGEENG